MVGTKTLSITRLSITMKNKRDTQHKQHSIKHRHDAEFHYAECCYAEYRYSESRGDVC